MAEWTLIAKADDLIRELETTGSLKEIEFDGKKIVLSYVTGEFAAINNKCNHMGGPLSRGKLKNGCIECPWHYWQFNLATHVGREPKREPGKIRVLGLSTTAMDAAYPRFSTSE